MSHLEMSVTLGKLGHTWKNGLEWVILGKMGHNKNNYWEKMC